MPSRSCCNFTTLTKRLPCGFMPSTKRQWSSCICFPHAPDLMGPRWRSPIPANRTTTFQAEPLQMPFIVFRTAFHPSWNVPQWGCIKVEPSEVTSDMQAAPVLPRSSVSVMTKTDAGSKPSGITGQNSSEPRALHTKPPTSSHLSSSFAPCLMACRDCGTWHFCSQPGITAWKIRLIARNSSHECFLSNLNRA